MGRHRLIDKSYYYRDGDDFTYYKVTKASNTKRSCGTKDTLLTLTDFKVDYELKELVETGEGLMWYSSLKEDLKPITKAVYESIVKRALKNGNEKIRYLFKIELKD